jgi:membrane associated rhomboid family serine protease
MGLYDRDYTRSEPRGYGGPFALGQSMVTTIIVICSVLFLANLLFTSQSNWITEHLAATGNSLVKPWLWWQLLTYGFAHDPRNVFHLVFNMLGLWFLGRAVEDWLGRWEFLRFYLIAVIIGGIVHTARICLFIDPAFWPQGTLVGASGAVTAVVMLFIVKYPHVKLLLFFALPVPAWVVGVLIIGQDMLGSGLLVSNPFADTENAARVAYDVHLAGAAFAFAYFFTGMNFGRWLPGRWGSFASGASRTFRSGPNLKVHTPAEENFDDERYRDLDEEADRILAKLGTQGESSLTAAERRVLEDYSRRMRQKHR